MSAGWTHHSGTAVALDLESVDTDQLIPARFMSVPRVQGYGPYLLHDLRYDGAGQKLPDFVLNRHEGASILVRGAISARARRARRPCMRWLISACAWWLRPVLAIFSRPMR